MATSQRLSCLKSAASCCAFLIAVLLWLSHSTSVAQLTAAETLEEPASNGKAVAQRSSEGLVTFYDFRGTRDNTVFDRSGVAPSLDLTITKPKQVQIRDGVLTIAGETILRPLENRGNQANNKLSRAIRRTGEITLETWIAPADLKQSGPARIITLSANSSNRNFTLGQDGDRFDVRFRTTKTNSNGIPSLASNRNTVQSNLMHVVYTRDRRGTTRIFLDGSQNRQGRTAGRLSNWGSYQLALGNEHGSGRLWRGDFHLVAFYSRALSPKEVKRHFELGPEAVQPPAQRASQHSDPLALHFEKRIAPLLANHCLECHDSATHEGGLDLSKRVAAFNGGESGKVIMPGNSNESRLWETVVTDEMPSDRPPLTDEQKAWLKQWIDDGAKWTLNEIDPAIYLHGEHSAETWVRRLTFNEYIATISANFDVDIRDEAETLLPRELRADGFSNTAYNLGVDLKHIEAYARLAPLVVDRIDIPKFAERFRRNRQFTEKTMDDLIRRLGTHVFRGPLEDHEIVAYKGITTTVGAAGGDSDEVVRFLIEAMIQSPRFLYRIERQRGDGQSYPVGPHELATRLSYTLWGGPPDDTLKRLADSGELTDETVMRHEVQRMLDDPRARTHSLRFVDEWLNLGRLRTLRPNAERFPHWNPALASDMQAETRAYFEEVVWNQGRPLSDLLQAQVTFLTPDLAKHYGIADDAPRGEPNDAGLARYDLTNVAGRGGLLTQGSVLTVGGDDASMVTRGLLVMHELLRGVVKDPPPCVNTTPVASEPGLTQRAIAEARIGNANCGGCHAKFEPLAFGLEKFDGIGGYHDKDEHGNLLRDDGRILFPGAAKSVAYKNSAEMMKLMASSDRVQQSFTWKLAQFAVGRPLGSSDAAIMASIHKEAKEAGMTYKSVMTAIVQSDLIQTIQTESDSVTTEGASQ